MMPSEIHKKLQNVSGLKEIRQNLANEIIADATLFPELIEFSFQFSNKYSHKGCWILELVSSQKLEWLQPHLDFFCENIEKLKDESSIRAISKVCLFMVTSHFGKKEIQLSDRHLQKITESCFDWLINDTKVASKCYSIRSLYVLGKHSDWIYPELRIILTKDYLTHSAAYKAVAREILKKIK
jgi:hypothetical protein